MERKARALSPLHLSYLPRRPQAEDDKDGAVVDEGDDGGRGIDEPVEAGAQAGQEARGGRIARGAAAPAAPLFPTAGQGPPRLAEPLLLPLLHLFFQDGVEGQLDGFPGPLVALVGLKKKEK